MSTELRATGLLKSTVDPTTLLIDDMFSADTTSCLGTRWQVFSDQVMGGLSSAGLSLAEIEGRRCLRLRGFVSTANNGGFAQAALDLAPHGEPRDLSRFRAIEFDVFGNHEDYNLHLRTPDVTRPWQSYRATFHAPAEWTRVRIDFTDFVPHRLETPLNPAAIRRVALVAIGRDFRADLAFANLQLTV